MDLAEVLEARVKESKMLQELVFHHVDIRPGPSSQTTTQWPLSVRIGEEQLVSENVSLDGGNVVIQPPREKTWDEVMAEVLHDYSKAWKRLAAL
jgi:hypothetical protein